MNYDFLQSYNIPITRQSGNNQYNQYADSSRSAIKGAYGSYSVQTDENIPGVNTAYYGYGNANTYENNYQSATGSTGCYYENPERFLPASKNGTNYTFYKTFKRKNNSIGGGSAAKKEAPIPEVTNDGKLFIFLGRDESYPDDLNSLIHPSSCDLCNVKMNSRAFAKDHYESKAHDKHISAWLFKNFTEKGVNPPTIKRFIKQGPTGPDAYYCEACDLKLTSLTHASQHYAGKKHRLVIAKRSKPSGVGYYNSEGKWVRTSTKLTPKSSKDSRFQIGEQFKYTKHLTSPEILNNKNSQSTIIETTMSAADATITSESEVKPIIENLTKKHPSNNLDQDPALFCSICKVSVTSALQMTMHLSGTKHVKKLKLAGLNPSPIDNNGVLKLDVIPTATITDNVLLSAIKEEINPNPTDLSMYRTPSGQYYCKTCNTSMSNLPGLEQHLKGKRHLKKLTEEKALASLTAKKNEKE